MLNRLSPPPHPSAHALLYLWTSFRTESSRFIHTIAGVRMFLFSRLKNIPLCRRSHSPLGTSLNLCSFSGSGVWAPDSESCSLTYRLCDSGQITYPLCDSVASSVKRDPKTCFTECSSKQVRLTCIQRNLTAHSSSSNLALTTSYSRSSGWNTDAVKYSYCSFFKPTFFISLIEPFPNGICSSLIIFCNCFTLQSFHLSKQRANPVLFVLIFCPMI